MKRQHRHIIRSLAAITVLFVVGPREVCADEVDRGRGFYLGGSVLGSSVHVEEDPDAVFQIDDGGVGITLETGYTFNRVFSLELVMALTGYETTDPSIDAGLGAVQLFAHYQFRPGHQFRPFVKGGIGAYGLRLEQDSVAATVSGGGVAFGGGIDYFFTKHFAMGFDLTHNIIGYDSLEFEFDGNTAGTEIDQAGAMTTFGMTFNFYF